MPKGESKLVGNGERAVGLMVAYGPAGQLIYERKDFRAGRDTLPRGVALAAHATALFNDKGEVLLSWDPWKVFRDKVRPKG